MTPSEPVKAAEPIIESNEAEQTTEVPAIENVVETVREPVSPIDKARSLAKETEKWSEASVLLKQWCKDNKVHYKKSKLALKNAYLTELDGQPPFDVAKFLADNKGSEWKPLRRLLKKEGFNKKQINRIKKEFKKSITPKLTLKDVENTLAVKLDAVPTMSKSFRDYIDADEPVDCYVLPIDEGSAYVVAFDTLPDNLQHLSHLMHVKHTKPSSFKDGDFEYHFEDPSLPDRLNEYQDIDGSPQATYFQFRNFGESTYRELHLMVPHFTFQPGFTRVDCETGCMTEVGKHFGYDLPSGLPLHKYLDYVDIITVWDATKIKFNKSQEPGEQMATEYSFGVMKPNATHINILLTHQNGTYHADPANGVPVLEDDCLWPGSKMEDFYPDSVVPRGITKQPVCDKFVPSTAWGATFDFGSVVKKHQIKAKVYQKKPDWTCRPMKMKKTGRLEKLTASKLRKADSKAIMDKFSFRRSDIDLDPTREVNVFDFSPSEISRLNLDTEFGQRVYLRNLSEDQFTQVCFKALEGINFNAEVNSPGYGRVDLVSMDHKKKNKYVMTELKRPRTVDYHQQYNENYSPEQINQKHKSQLYYYALSQPRASKLCLFGGHNVHYAVRRSAFKVDVLFEEYRDRISFETVREDISRLISLHEL